MGAVYSNLRTYSMTRGDTKGYKFQRKDKTGADIIWDSGLEDYPTLCEGRDDLAEIAHKYAATPDHIRIVFAFDS